MAVGQTFTIEPMLTMTKAGARERFWDDKWTAVTVDGSWTAQFEHTLLITPSGVEILTLTPAAAASTVQTGAAALAEAEAAPAAPSRPLPAPKAAPPPKHKRRPQSGVNKKTWALGPQE